MSESGYKGPLCETNMTKLLTIPTMYGISVTRKGTISVKKLRLFLLLLGLVACVLVLSGCACIPYQHEWKISTYTKTDTYLGGVQKETEYSYGPDYENPFGGIVDESVPLTFREDGTVSFTTWDGEALEGTYTYEADNYLTTFQITFAGGETASGSCEKDLYNRYLELSFRDVTYQFNGNGTTLLPEEIAQGQARIAGWVRAPYGNSGLKTGLVTEENGEFFLEGKKLLDGKLAILAVDVSLENKLTKLTELRAGECTYYPLQENGWLAGYTIYYVEQEPGDPIVSISERLSWVGELQAGDILKVKATQYYAGVAPGSKKSHTYITDEDGIRDALLQLQALTLCEAPEASGGIDGGDVRELTFYTETETYTFRATDGYWFDEDGNAWQLNRWASPPMGDCISFVIYDDTVEVLSEEGESLGSFEGKLAPIEFVWKQGAQLPEGPYVLVICQFGKLAVYDSRHFSYGSMYYEVTGEADFSFVFED